MSFPRRQAKPDWVALVAAHSLARNGPRLVMLALAHFAYSNGVSRPKLKDIIAFTRIGRRKAIEHLLTLASMGEIQKTELKGRGNGNIYRITLPIKGPVSPTLYGEEKVPTGGPFIREDTLIALPREDVLADDDPPKVILYPTQRQATLNA